MNAHDLFKLLLSETNLIDSRVVHTEGNVKYINVSDCIIYTSETTNTAKHFNYSCEYKYTTEYANAIMSCLSPKEIDNTLTVNEFSSRYICPSLAELNNHKISVIMFVLAVWYDVMSVSIEYNMDTKITRLDIGTD